MIRYKEFYFSSHLPSLFVVKEIKWRVEKTAFSPDRVIDHDWILDQLHGRFELAQQYNLFYVAIIVFSRITLYTRGWLL